MEETLRVLVVDDNPDDRALIKRELSREFPRVQVTEVADAQAHALALAEEPFHLVITDYMLGWSNGLSILRDIKALWPECPVVMFTGTGNEEVAVEAMKNGLEDYVLKTPRHYIRLCAAVRQGLKHTAQRRALRQAENRYSRLFNNAPIGLYRITPAGEVVEANPALVHLLGYPDRETLLAVKAVDFYADPVDKQRWSDQMQHRGEVRGFELQLRQRDGRAVWVRNNARAVRDEAGEILGYEGSLEDVTPYRQAAEALRASESRFRLLMTNIPAVVFNSFANGDIDVFDHKIETLTGYLRAEFESRRRSWIDLIVEEDRQGAKAIFIRALKGDKAYIREYRIRNKAGKIVWVQERSQIVCDSEGRIRHICGVLFDITAHKEVEEEVQLKAALLDAVSDSVFLHDLEGHFHYVNEAAYKSRGYGKEELLAQDISTLPTPEHAAVRASRIDDLLKQGKTSFESAHLCKDGSVMPVEVHARLIALNGRTLILSAARDITERKVAETALADSFAKLHRALEGTVGALGATLEMRDPYTAGHQRRVTQLACALARELGFSTEQIEGIRVTGIVHDIGKIAVPAEILSKPGKISPMEFNLIKVHSQVGYDILKDIEFPWPVAQAVLQHHERFNGSGYPSGLTGGDIIPEARILMVADVVEAMASHRPYRPALGIDQALEEITKNKGILYDPEVVEVCVQLFTEKGFILP
jgi:PAS domain S-box-containing protein/putative nucleotidyltransferase with HDIG domain